MSAAVEDAQPASACPKRASYVRMVLRWRIAMLNHANPRAGIHVDARRAQLGDPLASAGRAAPGAG